MKKILIAVLLLCVVALPGMALEELLSADVELSPSGTYVDIGSDIKTTYAQKIGIYMETEGQASSDMNFRVLAKTENGGASEYFINNLISSTNLTLEDTVYTVADLTASQLIVVDAGVVPVIQIQGKSTIAGGTGGMAKVTSLKVAQTRK